jgi:processive 1,2-diacylglycerol beta-glucosyltransferase
MPAKRILLMYISQVSGHRSAAMAIERDAEVLNINAFQYTNPLTEKIIHRLYMAMLRKIPKIWDFLYDNPKIVQRTERLKEAINRMNSPKLKNLLDEFKPDAIACTQAFPCGMVSTYKKMYNSRIPLVAVLTDYVPHSYWIYDNVDYYISPSKEVSQKLALKGIPQNKIHCFGIPFDPKFNDSVLKEKVIQQLSLDVSLPVILLMGGGHGIGPIEKIIRSLENTGVNFQEIVVAGVNKKLYNFLKKNMPKFKKKIVLFEYVDNIHELMSIADIILTKPGGVTTAEALAKKLPMIIVNPLPGQEASNTAYLTAQGAAIKIDKPEDISKAVTDLFSHRERLNYLSEAASRISKPNSSLDIARLLLNAQKA